MNKDDVLRIANDLAAWQVEPSEACFSEARLLDFAARLEADLMASIRREESLLTQIGNMRAENEELRKDAARYRKKREIDYRKTVEKLLAPCEDWKSIHIAYNMSYDAAIDAAMGEQP